MNCSPFLDLRFFFLNWLIEIKLHFCACVTEGQNDKWAFSAAKLGLNVLQCCLKGIRNNKYPYVRMLQRLLSNIRSSY